MQMESGAHWVLGRVGGSLGFSKKALLSRLLGYFLGPVVTYEQISDAPGLGEASGE